MTNSDYLLNWTQELKGKIKISTFHKDDIRKSFLELIYDVAYSYYKAYLLFDFSDFINNHQIEFTKNPHDYLPHLKTIAATNRHQLLQHSYFNSLNRSLIIDSWSTFELAVSTFCNGIGEIKEISKLLDFHFHEILKVLKSTSLSEPQTEKLKKLFQKDHLTHVPIVRKTSFLFSKTLNYKRDEESDKSFLIFFGKFRNTMHTNFIYYGNDYEYLFGQTSFIFKNQKLIRWIDFDSINPTLYLSLVSELINIWLELSTTITFDNVIYYPDLERI